jgi:hypothetical protein
VRRDRRGCDGAADARCADADESSCGASDAGCAGYAGERADGCAGACDAGCAACADERAAGCGDAGCAACADERAAGCGAGCASGERCDDVRDAEWSGDDAAGKSYEPLASSSAW